MRGWLARYRAPYIGLLLLLAIFWAVEGNAVSAFFSGLFALVLCSDEAGEQFGSRSPHDQPRPLREALILGTATFGSVVLAVLLAAGVIENEVGPAAVWALAALAITVFAGRSALRAVRASD